MAYPGNYIKVVAYGTLYDGAEEWSCGISLVPGAPAGDTATFGQPASAEPYWNAWAALVADVNLAFSTKTHLVGVKANLVGTNGRYVSEGETTLWEPTTPVAGSGAAHLPPQCAFAVTLLTDKQRGRGSKGRFYLPLLAIPVGSDGLVSQTNINNMLPPVTTFLNALNAIQDGAKVGVASNIGTGIFMGATRARMGRAVDTQRRRRRSLVEAPTEGADITGGGGGPFT